MRVYFLRIYLNCDCKFTSQTLLDNKIIGDIMLYNLCNCPLKIGCCLMFSKSVNWSLRSWLNLQKSFRTSNVCSLVLSNKIVKRSYLVLFNSWMTVVWVKWNKIKIKMTYTLQLVIRDFTYQLNDKKLHNVQKRVSYRLDHYL